MNLNTAFSCLRPAFIRGSDTWDFKPGDIHYIPFGLLDEQNDFVFDFVLEWDADGETRFFTQKPDQPEFVPFWAIISCLVSASSTLPEEDLISALVELDFEDITPRTKSDARARIFAKYLAINRQQQLILQELVELDKRN